MSRVALLLWRPSPLSCANGGTRRWDVEAAQLELQDMPLYRHLVSRDHGQCADRHTAVLRLCSVLDCPQVDATEAIAVPSFHSNVKQTKAVEDKGRLTQKLADEPGQYENLLNTSVVAMRSPVCTYRYSKVRITYPVVGAKLLNTEPFTSAVCVNCIHDCPLCPLIALQYAVAKVNIKRLKRICSSGRPDD
eukprot:6172657-Pleurochrysis_carterae.AAC.2